ncbi:MAG: hypothetical protein NTV56_06390 [Alphaproteobacteria bacterium]|nr:hypothetical protein [Alphaproteobacteria bacterium]
MDAAGRGRHAVRRHGVRRDAPERRRAEPGEPAARRKVPPEAELAARRVLEPPPAVRLALQRGARAAGPDGALCALRPRREVERPAVVRVARWGQADAPLLAVAVALRAAARLVAVAEQRVAAGARLAVVAAVRAARAVRPAAEAARRVAPLPEALRPASSLQRQAPAPPRANRRARRPTARPKPRMAMRRWSAQRCQPATAT